MGRDTTTTCYCSGCRPGLFMAQTRDHCTQPNTTMINFPERNKKHLYTWKHLTEGRCISIMLSKCNLLILSVVRPHSSASRMWRGRLLRVASMPSESLLPLRQESGGADLRGRPCLSLSHMCMFHFMPQNPGLDNSPPTPLVWYSYYWRPPRGNEKPANVNVA